MKHWHDYKKQYKPVRALGSHCESLKLSLVLALFFVILLTIPLVSFRVRAETVGELNEKIDQKNADINKLEQEIEQYQIQLDSLEKQRNSLHVSLKQLDLTRKKLITDISITEKKIEKTNLKIRELSLEIDDKQSTIFRNIEAISLDIRKINELEQNDALATILSENGFTIIWNDIDNMATIGEEIRKMIIKLKKIKGELENIRTETTGAKNELVLLKGRLADQKKIVDQNTKDKQKLLAQTKNSETNYQKLLKDQSAKKEAFEKELRDYESQLQFILDPNKLPPPGVLSWPLDDIFVTQQFGAKTGPHRTYVSGHSGTDFRAKTPLPVRSMADGKVLGIGDTDEHCPGASFGKWIFIEHDNGLSSAYGHLSLIKVWEGQRVGRGEIIGYTGGTGRATGPHLHVSLYASKAVKVETVPSKTCPGKTLKQPVAAISGYLDPMYYLPL